MNMANELLLQADHISYSQGNRLILDQVSFELRRAQITTIIGPNGAGKSTLTNIVNGLIDNYTGKIERSSELRIGYLPQKVYVNTLMPLSVERLLRLTRQSSEAEIEQALAQSEVAYLRQRQVRSLSEGELKRVLLARTTLGKPDLIVLDEPTAGVDVSLRKDMWRIISELRASGVTIILTTHYIDEAEEIADRIGVINNGELILVEEKAKRKSKLGKKQLLLDLCDPVAAIPSSLTHHAL